MSYRNCAVLALALAFVVPAFAAELTPVGTWTTIDDSTGKPKSIVQITDDGGKLQGTKDGRDAMHALDRW